MLYKLLSVYLIIATGCPPKVRLQKKRHCIQIPICITTEDNVKSFMHQSRNSQDKFEVPTFYKL